MGIIFLVMKCDYSRINITNFTIVLMVLYLMRISAEILRLLGM